MVFTQVSNRKVDITRDILRLRPIGFYTGVKLMKPLLLSPLRLRPIDFYTGVKPLAGSMLA